MIKGLKFTSNFSLQLILTTYVLNDIARVLLYSFRDQLQPVSTGFLRFFAVPVHGSCILKLSGTGPVWGPSKKGNRTETRPDFKALRRIIHQDLKPDNVLMETCPMKRRIHIIDFGLSKQYYNPETNIHISFRDGLPFIGTAHYASVNDLIGVELSLRDDIESLSYILIYLMQGSLPWQGTKGKNCQARVDEKKLSTSPKVLCDGLPIAFKECLQYARSLKFFQCPDYQYLRGLFTDLHRQLVDDDSEFLSLGTIFSQSVTLPTGSDITKTETLPIKKRRVQGVQK